MDVSQSDLDNEKIKDLIVVCDNDTRWNMACHMIECVLELCHCINAFCAVNQQPVKQNRDENDNNESVCRDTLTPSK